MMMMMMMMMMNKDSFKHTLCKTNNLHHQQKKTIMINTHRRSIISLVYNNYFIVYTCTLTSFINNTYTHIHTHTLYTSYLIHLLIILIYSISYNVCTTYTVRLLLETVHFCWWRKSKNLF